jgi:hypothetical protein
MHKDNHHFYFTLIFTLIFDNSFYLSLLLRLNDKTAYAVKQGVIQLVRLKMISIMVKCSCPGKTTTLTLNP